MDDVRSGDAEALERNADTASEAVERRRPQRREQPHATRQVSERGGDGRGRSAAKPSDIPARGWKDILWRVYAGVADDRILAVQLVSGVLPGGAVEVIRNQLNSLAAQPRGTLGISFLIGLAISLWSANGGIKALFDALNTVYGEKEERSFIRLNATTLAFTLAMIGFVLVALACIVAIPVALTYLPGFIGFILNIIRWPVMLILVAVALAFIYRYGPSRDEPQWRWLSWGSAFAALAWLGFSAIFSYYAAHFGNFDKTYGSLGAVIGLMTWMWLSVAVILIGGKLNAEMEHQTARDTTEGPPKPMGARQAKMADTVGPVRS